MEEALIALFKNEEYTVDELYYLALELIDYFRLSEFITSVEFHSLKADTIYKPDEKKIILDPDSMLNSSFYEFEQHGSSYNMRLTRLYLIYILKAIIYELTHVNQIKIADEKTDDTLHTIIREGVELNSRVLNDLTDDEIDLFRFHQDQILVERQATINSLYQLRKLNYLQIFTGEELAYIEDRFKKELYKGYYCYKTPVQTYYRLRGKQEELKSLDFNDKDYSTFTRLSWGLPVDKQILRTKNKINLV